jgi:two-component system, OmpR family, copper resistance phosphate regulon response regulator CusR
MMQRLLVIEDNQESALAVQEGLRQDYEVDLAFTASEGEVLALGKSYDLIIIDLHLPDKQGTEVCRAIRKEKIDTPIIILTAEMDESAKVGALDVGADDYLTKPYSLAELKARIRAQIRRNSGQLMNDTLTVEDLTLDLNKKTATRGSKTITLRRKEMALLEYLMRNQGKIVSRDMLLNHVWKDNDTLYNTIDVHVKYLRDRVDRGFPKKLIKTVYGAGYKIEA